MTDEIKFDPRNYRIHSDKNKKHIKKSLQRNGAGRSAVMDNQGYLIAGNGVYEQAKALGMGVEIIPSDGTKLIVIKRTDIDYGTDKRKSLALDDNATSDMSTFDMEIVCEDFPVDELEEHGIDVAPVDSKTDVKQPPRANLADDFLIMPASVLNTRAGDWQARKRAWVDLIGDSGDSREGLLGFVGLSPLNNNVSILDPVLAELLIKWFTPTVADEQLKICDPFAGDSVFGYVAGKLGAEFTGIELRQEQTDLNNARGNAVNARYICDDGQNIARHLLPESQDFVFSCPPYFDLEKYSDNPMDASNQASYADFIQIIDHAFAGACACLKKNRFAAIVMSNVRNHSNGGYYDICGDICRIMEKQGLILYNEFILVNSIGSGAMRCKGNMKSRKNVRTHQEVLIFYKGNNPLKDVPGEFGDIKFLEMEEQKDESENMAQTSVDK